MTATSYVEQILRQHLDLYKEEINRIYKERSTKKIFYSHEHISFFQPIGQHLCSSLQVFFFLSCVSSSSSLDENGEKTQPKVNSVSESVVRDQEEDQDPIEQSEKIPDEKPVQNILTEKVAQVEEIIPLPPYLHKTRRCQTRFPENLSASYTLPTTRQRLSQHGDQATDSQCRPTDWQKGI